VTVLEPDVALVFSPEGWVETLHRHLTDHGGARVRQIVMDPGLAFEDDYGVLVVSQRWPALTRAFVTSLHDTGRRILGVFESVEPAGRDHLLSLGVDATLPADAPVDEFVRIVTALAPETPVVADLVPTASDVPSAPRTTLTAVGGPAGSGTTEAAIALAVVSATTGRSTALVDADEVQPAVATRLGLAVDPNLRTAIEAVEYGLGELSAALQGVMGTELAVITGLPNAAAWSDLRPGEVLDVMDALARIHTHLVVDTANRIENVSVDGRGRYAIGRAVLERADVIVGVGSPTPVGVSRLIGWVADTQRLNRRAPLHLVVNRAPRDAFRRAEIAAELERNAPDASVAFLPADRRVETAAWNGSLVPRGRYVHAIAELAVDVLPPAPRALTRPPRRRAPMRLAVRPR
jgi:MinD-like ATPase involved in chromosome partitioning or flagellar assembly